MPMLLTGAGSSRPGPLNSALLAARQVLWPQLASAANQSPTWAAGGSSIFGGWTLRSGLGTYWEHPPLYLPAGNYTTRMLCINQSNAGIVTLSLSGEDVATFDLYGGSSVANQIEVDTFTVDTPGFYTPRFTITGQTGSGNNTWINQVEIVSSSPYYTTTDALLPGVVDVPPYLYSADSGTVTWVASIHSSRMWGGHLAEITSSANWWIEWSVWLPAGTFDLGIVAFLGTNYGIVDFTLDGSPIGTVDFYDPVGASNALKTLSGISVGATGLHTLRLTCTSKNASSSNKFIGLNWMQFVRTAAANLPATRGRETIELYPWMADDASTTLSWLSLPSAIFYGHLHAGIAIGNWIEFSNLDLSSGSWEAEILHSKNTSYGIAHLLLDGADQGQADFFAGSLTHNQRSTIAFTVATSGLHTLRLSADSKNASSTGYYLPMQLIRLTRTGD